MKRIAILALFGALIGLPVEGQEAGGSADPFRAVVPVPYDPERLRDFGAIRPLDADSGDLVWARIVSGRPPRLFFLGEFRVVNWNASGHDSNAPTDAPVVAADVLRQVDDFNANVITLQELREDVYGALREGLLDRDRAAGHFDHRAWTCEAHEFGAMVDFRVTCVKGRLANLQVRRLVDAGSLNYERYKNREFWGYMQVDYFGVTITNVHVRDFWKEDHVCQLHHDVRSGIVAGDFNYETPELSPDGVSPWFQTDVNGLITLPTQGTKSDHVLTVHPHVEAEAKVVGTHGSNHEMLLTRFRLLVPLDPAAPALGRVFVPSTGCNP